MNNSPSQKVYPGVINPSLANIATTNPSNINVIDPKPKDQDLGAIRYRRPMVPQVPPVFASPRNGDPPPPALVLKKPGRKLAERMQG